MVVCELCKHESPLPLCFACGVMLEELERYADTSNPNITGRQLRTAVGRRGSLERGGRDDPVILRPVLIMEENPYEEQQTIIRQEQEYGLNTE